MVPQQPHPADTLLKLPYTVVRRTLRKDTVLASLHCTKRALETNKGTHNERILVTFCGLKAFPRANAWTKRLQALPRWLSVSLRVVEKFPVSWKGGIVITKVARSLQYRRQKLTENYWRTERHSLLLQRKKELLCKKMIRVKRKGWYDRQRADSGDSLPGSIRPESNRISREIATVEHVTSKNWVNDIIPSVDHSYWYF